MKEQQRVLSLGSKNPKSNFDGGYSNMNNEELYKDIKSYMDAYLETSQREKGLLIIYASATHVYQKYQNFPILHITGDFETGKNRRLDLIKGLCYKPKFYSNLSIASLFRTTDETKGTILIDEADSVLDDSQVKNFLLSGYQSGLGIPRMVKDSGHIKGYRTEEFDIYGPKILVTREGTEDDALNSRFITIITLPLPSDSNVPDIITAEELSRASELKTGIEAMLSEIEDINSADNEIGLRGRDSQLFKPLIDVATLYGDEALNDLKDFIKTEFIPDSKYDTMLTIQQDLIRALDEAWASENPAHLKTLVGKLVNINSDYRHISPKRIARVLRSLGFKTHERDKNGHYVTPNSELLSILKEKYQIQEYTGEVGVADVVQTKILRHRIVSKFPNNYFNDIN